MKILNWMLVVLLVGYGKDVVNLCDIEIKTEVNRIGLIFLFILVMFQIIYMFWSEMDVEDIGQLKH